MVAAKAVSAALDRVREDTVAEGGVTDAGGDIQGGIEGLARFFVADELDAEEEAGASNVADDGQFTERLERPEKFASVGRDTGEEIFFSGVVENSESRGGGDGMGGIGEAVEECAGAALDGRSDFAANKDSAERSVAAGDALTDENDVGFNIPVIHSEILAGTAHAGHDFVGYEKNAVTAADFRYAQKVFRRRSHGTQSCAGNGFDEKSGDVFGAEFANFFVEFVGAGNTAGGIVQVQRAAIAIARRDVVRFGQERREGSAAFDVAGERERA